MVYNVQQLEMKKLLISAMLLIGMLAGAMMLSSFTKQNKEKIERIDISTSDKTPVWKGRAYRNGAYGKYECVEPTWSQKFTVYPTDGTCGSYYAILGWDGDNGNMVHYTVRNNPDYDYRSQDHKNVAYYSHYIIFGNINHFFKM